jgi:hypothetical protein
MPSAPVAKAAALPSTAATLRQRAFHTHALLVGQRSAALHEEARHGSSHDSWALTFPQKACEQIPKRACFETFVLGSFS